MAPSSEELHFLVVPLAAQGHIIPMVDVARLLAARGSRVTIVTTPVNAARNRAAVDGARKAGLAVELLELPLPSAQLGLPEGIEAVDQLNGQPPEISIGLFKAIWTMAGPLEEYLRALPRLPDCLVADLCNPWTAPVCERLGIPRLVMHCPSAYFQLAVHRLNEHGVYDGGVEDYDPTPIEVPGFPVRAFGSKTTMRGFFQYPGVEQEHLEALHAEATADGLLFNSFRAIEADFLDAYAAALGKTTWAVGPTALVNNNTTTAAAAASSSSILSWLDARPPDSVLYVSFGSISLLSAKQLAKLADGLEASGRPFVWAIKEEKADAAVRSQLDEEGGFEARVKDRGLLVRGWAPQVAILSHPAVGGFLTHCGWNSTLEALSHGVPALTWPTNADQFCSEQVIVDVLDVGVRSGVKIPALYVPPEAEGVQVESGDVERAIVELMDGGPEGAARRARARKIAVQAKAAMEEGGTSHSDLTDMIRHVSELSRKRRLQLETADATCEEATRGADNAAAVPVHLLSQAN
uniref:Uncharacterized protein n=1 Tax=Avena sativa TaxID=4498 RepID=A0ACD5U7V2_AVESA